MIYYTERIFSIIAAIILLQTLYFKFSAAEESVYIFTKLGIEPFGRIGAGIAELIAAFLLMFRGTSLIGAIFSVGIISGAIMSHIFILGIKVQNDGGLLFGLALAVLFCNLMTILLHKDGLIRIFKK